MFQNPVYLLTLIYLTENPFFLTFLERTFTLLHCDFQQNKKLENIKKIKFAGRVVPIFGNSSGKIIKL